MESFIKAIFHNWSTKLKQVIILIVALFGVVNWPLKFKLLLLIGIICLDILWDYCQEKLCSKELLNNFCQNIYYSLFTEEDFRDIRVSVLITRKFLKWGCRILEVRGRFVQGEGAEFSKIFFKKGQGIAGICFSTNQIFKEDTLPNPHTEKQEYVKICKEKYKLKWWQIKFLNRLAQAYICFPIEYFDKKGKVAAVLSLDSDKSNIFSRRKFQQKKKILERELSTIKIAFFQEA